MMQYRFDEELQRMIYIFEAEPETKITTDAGREWYKEQVNIAEEVGSKHYQELIADLANKIYKDEDAE